MIENKKGTRQLKIVEECQLSTDIAKSKTYFFLIMQGL
jgi:hypothetical protein